MAGFIMGLLPASATATQSVFIVYVAYGLVLSYIKLMSDMIFINFGIILKE